MIPPRIPPVHLVRGAPSVRSWSRYQAIDPRFSVCGCALRDPVLGVQESRHCIAEAEVTCPYCQDLMKPRGASGAK